MGTQGTGRKRSTKKERSTAEDDALNLIAREAEARLAAKRAARAEAREIRMKELERQQKELSDDDERMSVGSRGSVRVEDRDYLEKGSRAASALTAATLTSLGGTSSRRGSGETAITVDAETSIREIKDALAEVEEKYRKAMVSNAQLDNEKNNLMYQVDTLKDSLMELEELLSESRREYEEKVKENEREKHAHSVLQFQFNEMKETLKQSEELLNKHGIVLGPDLNINGDIGEAEVDGSPSGDSAGQPAQDSQTSPAEGNSMLEIRLRKLVDEREKMIEQVKKLKAQLEQKSPKNGSESSSSPDGEIVENGNDPNIIELQRDSNRQISDYKFKLVKAEQEVTALEQNVTRLEGQVTRYKSAAENAEKVEDELKAEKRKLQREVELCFLTLCKD
uniref:LRR binding FLII interacting protein 1 n=1 Tax=Lates calcarifer TaxID=8187 RepID=A0A4W6FRK8_LATCA